MIADASAEVGEGPVWESGTGLLHWVDILAGKLHSTDVARGETTTRSVPTYVGAAVPRHAGGFVAGTREGFAVITDEGGLDTRVPLLSQGHRFNDGKCDALGRFWAGSNHLEFLPEHGALHVLEGDWTSRRVLDGLTLPNGLGWSPDQRKFYLVDSLEYCLLGFDFDLATGSLGSPRRIHEFDRGTGIPDGLTVDHQGRLWVARWGGGRIDCLTSTGCFLGSLTVPVSQPSSCAFVGDDMSILAVTSARQGLDADASTLDGSVLAISGILVAGSQVRGMSTYMFGG